MPRRNKPLTESEKEFFAGFTGWQSHVSSEQARIRIALDLAQRLRRFMPGLPGEMQDDLHNAAFALESWAEKQEKE